MRTMKALTVGLLLAVLAFAGAYAPAKAAHGDENLPMHDNQKIRTIVSSGAVTMVNDDYTGWVQLYTITPEQTLKSCKILVDLAKATTGFAANNTSQTIQVSLARKVDGTNWRTATNLASTAVSGTNAAGLMVEFNAFEVTPTEGLRVMVKFSAETGGNVVLPVTVIYSSGAAAVTSAAT